MEESKPKRKESRLVRLYNQKSLLESNIEEIKNRIQQWTEILDKKNRKVLQLISIIGKIENRALHVSEHAIQRFQQRIEDIPDEEVVERIRSNQKLINAIKVLKKGEFPIDGVIYVVSDNTIVTVKCDE